MSKFLFVLGSPVENSLSPKMHNAGFQALKIDSEYLYFALDTKDLPGVSKFLHQECIQGASITIPFKEDIINFLDKNNLSKAAKEIGAVNTVYKKNEMLFGENTDYLGFIETLKNNINLESLKNKKALILGSGGAAKAILYALKDLEMEIDVYSRSRKDIKTIFGKKISKVKIINEIKETASYKLVINATPVGMKGHEENRSPIAANLLHPEMICFDVIYNPKMTKFLKDAKKKGAKIISGLEMLLFQGAKAFELWTDQKAPIEAMKKAIGKF